MGFSSLVAPYEADAQIALMSEKNMVDCVLTTDSDQAFYGTEIVRKIYFFKFSETVKSNIQFF